MIQLLAALFLAVTILLGAAVSAVPAAEQPRQGGLMQSPPPLPAANLPPLRVCGNTRQADVEGRKKVNGGGLVLCPVKKAGDRK